MNPTFTEEERTRLDERVAEAEKRTGAQIVLAFTKRSDVYAELPWKAFALGAGVAGLTATLLDLLRPGWTASHTILLTTTALLAAGAVSALASVFVPSFARLFLDGFRAETEVRQYAESLFLSRQIFATSGRTGVLLLVSLFERRTVILPDAGLRSRLSTDEQSRIIERMSDALAERRLGRAFEEGVNGLEQALGAVPPGTAMKDELPNDVIEGEGA